MQTCRPVRVCWKEPLTLTAAPLVLLSACCCPPLPTLQALAAKYRDPPKSLQEAARRAWAPIACRSCTFDRRQRKAAEVERAQLAQLLGFFDAHLHPDGPQHAALCVQIWGGDGGDAAAAEQQGGRLLRPADVAAFKAAAALMPQPDVVLPPPPADAGGGMAVLPSLL